MSKSTLSITVPHNYRSIHPPYVDVQNTRTIEVPSRLPEAFNFKHGGRTLTAEVSWGRRVGACIERIEHDGPTPPTADEFSAADAHATSILATIKAALGITGPVPPGSPLPAIALAYEAEVAAYEACVKAHGALPRVLHGLLLALPAPDSEVATGIYSRSAQMLAKYVEHVVEQAAKEVK